MQTKLYSKPNCHNCDIVKDFITKHNLQNLCEIDNSANVDFVRNAGYMQFPVLEYNGQVIAGLENILNVLTVLMTPVGVSEVNQNIKYDWGH